MRTTIESIEKDFVPNLIATLRMIAIGVILGFFLVACGGTTDGDDDPTVDGDNITETDGDNDGTEADSDELKCIAPMSLGDDGQCIPPPDGDEEGEVLAEVKYTAGSTRMVTYFGNGKDPITIQVIGLDMFYMLGEKEPASDLWGWGTAACGKVTYCPTEDKEYELIVTDKITGLYYQSDFTVIITTAKNSDNCASAFIAEKYDSYRCCPGTEGTATTEPCN